MSSRTEILSKIKANKPKLISLPEINTELFTDGVDLVSQFKKMVEAVGGTLFSVKSKSQIISKVSSLHPKGNTKYAALPNSENYNTLNINEITQLSELEDLDVLVLEGEFGVSENGAIWISDANIPKRVLPFITKNLVIALDKKKIVATQHHAYQLLKNNNYNNYGLFISGPSKTADIEQSLVIGAQGALTLSVLLY